MSSRTRIALVAPALAAVTVLLLSACNAGSGDSAAAAPSPAATNGAQQRGQGTDGANPDRGGTSGQIASVTGAVMQLRGTDSQTAVTWTDVTTFTAQVAGTLSDVTVGSCVLAVAAPSTSSGSASGTPDTTSPIAATTVRITPAAADGTCTTGFGAAAGGFRGGQRPNGAPTDAPRRTRPSGAPTGAPGGGQFRAFGGVASGKVTAIDGSTLTVDAVGADDATTNRTVTVSAATTYTTTKTADATAVVVGQCATARGQADSSGKVTATSVTISAPTDGSCSSGFGGGFFGGGQRGGQGGPATGGQQGGGSNA